MTCGRSAAVKPLSKRPRPRAHEALEGLLSSCARPSPPIYAGKEFVMRNIGFGIAMASALAMGSCSADETNAPVKVEQQGFESYGNATYAAIVTAVVDSVTINSLVVNRGNCDVGGYLSFPMTLKFGNSINTGYTCMHILEVEVGTDQGSWTFKFK